MDDLTLLYITASEMPSHWIKYQTTQLLKAVGDTPIVSVSRKPMKLGHNIVEKNTRCHWNIYRQMQAAAKLAQTPFVAMVEDDTLYPREHFTEKRPPEDAVSYNRSRWSLFVWDTIYCLRQRISNCTLIAPTKLLVEALEERHARWPHGAPNEFTGEVGRAVVHRRLGLAPRKMVEWYSTVPVIQLNHPAGTDEGQQKQRKTHGQLKANEIPYWGRAENIIGAYQYGRA
jgi:hypothetical protein